MTYKEKYYKIINSGYKTKPENLYTEKHHIVPKSICILLKKSQANLVYLTAQNHFLAHYYIWKWFRDELKDKKWSKKMCFALNMMKRIITKSDDIQELSKIYEEVRKDLSEVISDSHKGKPRSEETRKKLSEALKKSVLQYDKDGNFIREWKSAIDVQIEIGITKGNINKCCLGKRKSAGKFVWKYKDEKTEL